MGQFPNKKNKEPDQQGNGRKGGGGGGGFHFRALMLWVVIVLIGVVVLNFMDPASKKETPYLNQFYNQLQNGQVEKVKIQDNQIVYTLDPSANPGNEQERTRQIPIQNAMIENIDKKITAYNDSVPPEQQVQYSAPPEPLLLTIFKATIPWILLLALMWFFISRMMRGSAGGGVLAFGKSRAKMTKRRVGVTFDDVAGVTEAKEEVTEIIEFLKNPQKFERLGGRVPRGILLVGQPGTGKTLLAKAIAGEADRPFFSISGSDFVEMFVGVGASRVRDLFRQAKENAPCIVFLDEIDAVGRRRGTGLGGGHDEREQTLNAILVEMDGFDSDDRVILIAATNRPDVLDPALLRPGRFDRQIVVDPPDLNGREQILKVHAKKIKLAPDVDLHQIARGTASFSGADLANLINESAIIAVMKGKEYVQQEDLEEARDKVRWGREKKSRAMTEDERRTVAVHESGHAIVGKMLEPDVDPIHKVGIIPRGMSLGATMYLPREDTYLMQRKRLIGNITTALGGRAAEELFTNDITSGVQNDLEMATELARMMVCKWGMTNELGPINYTENQETLFLGREVTKNRNISEETAQKIDAAIRHIIDDCNNKARQILEEHKDALARLADALLEYETLDRHEVELILDGKPIQRKKQEQEKPAAEKTEQEKPQTADNDDALPGFEEGIQPA